MAHGANAGPPGTRLFQATILLLSANAQVDSTLVHGPALIALQQKACF